MTGKGPEVTQCPGLVAAGEQVAGQDTRVTE
jgi:hypothetical protein